MTEIGETLNKYWPLLLALVGIMGTWVRMQTIDADHEKRLCQTEQDIKDMSNKFDPVLLQIQKDIVEIKTILKIKFEE